MSAKIFMVEMTVSNIELDKLLEDVRPDLETCVVLRLFEHVEMEVCDCDLGSLTDLQDVSKGQNCVFPLSNDLDVAAVNASINVFKKDEKNQRLFVGRFDLNLEEIFKKLMKGRDMSLSQRVSNVLQSDYNLKPSLIQSTTSSPIVITPSVKSLKSEPIKTDLFQMNQEPMSETIKGMFPLFNLDDENIGLIGLTLRISCYGNVITQPKIVASQVSAYHKTPNVFLGQKPSSVDTAPDLYQLCSYKKSKNEASANSSDSSIACDCQEPCLDVDEKEASSEECVAMPPPSPVESCTRQPSDDYDEYSQEINGNSLVIRIAKGARMRAEVLESNNNCGKKSCLKDLIKYSRDHDKVNFVKLAAF